MPFGTVLKKELHPELSKMCLHSSINGHGQWQKCYCMHLWVVIIVKQNLTDILQTKLLLILFLTNNSDPKLLVCLRKAVITFI